MFKNVPRKLLRLEPEVKTRKRPNWERRTQDVTAQSSVLIARKKSALAEQAAWVNFIG